MVVMVLTGNVLLLHTFILGFMYHQFLIRDFRSRTVFLLCPSRRGVLAKKTGQVGAIAFRSFSFLFHELGIASGIVCLLERSTGSHLGIYTPSITTRGVRS